MPPIHSARFEFAAQSDVGLIRAQNEDAIAVSPQYGFAILADGMGGYNAGEVASAIAVDTVKQFLENGLNQPQQATTHESGGVSTRLGARTGDAPDAATTRFRDSIRAGGKRLGSSPQQHTDHLQQLMVESIQRANIAILEAACAEPQYEGMGTTLVTALFHHDKITIAHVGDSRAYRLRYGELVQITKDHSLVQEQIDAGLVAPEDARFFPQKNLVTRAVGVGIDMEVEVHEHEVEQGDLYLLCSDGLTDMLDAPDILNTLTEYQSSLDDACKALVQRANEQGGRDNISVILARVSEGNAESNSFFGRILNWLAD